MNPNEKREFYKGLRERIKQLRMGHLFGGTLPTLRTRVGRGSCLGLQINLRLRRRRMIILFIRHTINSMVLRCYGVSFSICPHHRHVLSINTGGNIGNLLLVMNLILRPLNDVNDVTWSIVISLIILLAGTGYYIYTIVKLAYEELDDERSDK